MYLIIYFICNYVEGGEHMNAHTLADQKRVSELLELEFLVLGSCPVWVL